MKIVINDCYGGFGLSKKAMEILNIEDEYNIERNSAKLVEVVETLGEEANGNWGLLEIVEIPDDVTDWRINDYDGREEVIYVLNGKMYDAV